METVHEPLATKPSREWIYGLLLILALIVAYQPVLQAGYIWDDDGRIWANPCVIGPLGLKEIWTTNSADICPLVITAFWAEHALWGIAPLPYHLVNLALHAACAVLLGRVLQGLRIPGAWLGAALWAMHPVQVETVAWVTEQKNTQSGVFYLLTILFYLRVLRGDPRKGTYALTLFFAALALASKSSTIVLPLVLGLCAWWIKGRWHRRTVMKLAPIAVMAIFPVVLTLWTQKLRFQDPETLQFTRSFPERLATAGDAVWFYLGKLVWPHPLIFIYPRWQVDAASPISYLPLLAVLAVFVVLWIQRDKWARPWFFAFATFIAALLPVLGLVDGYFWRYSLVGDHFQYLASMGPLALAGAGLARWAEVALPRKSTLHAALGGGLLAVLGALDWQRAHVFKSNETLWTDTVVQNPASWLAHTNLGTILMQRGKVDEAESHYKQSLGYNPDYVEAHYNLGQAYVKKGRMADAIVEYQKTLEIQPDFVLARVNLGWVLTQTGKPEEGMAQYQAALATNPRYSLAHYYIGLADLQTGRSDDALTDFREALADNPGLGEARYNLGLLLINKGQVDEAIEQLAQAIALNPQSAEAYNSLGLALLKRGQGAAAIAQIQQALQLDPGLSDAHFNLGNAYLAARQIDGAITEFQTAVKLNPTYAEAHNNLAVALFSSGRLDEAVAQFQEFARLNPGDPHAKENLAKAQELLARQRAAGK